MKKLNNGYFFIKLVTVGFSLFFQFQVWSIDQKGWIQCRELHERLGQVAGRLESRLQRDTGLLQDLNARIPEISGVEKQLNDIADGTQGANNAGVYLVTLPDGRKQVLKLVSEAGSDMKKLGDDFWPANGDFPTDPRNIFRSSAEIQTALARLGMAPQIQGLIPPGSFEAWYLANKSKFVGTRIEELMNNPNRKRIVGVFMDPIEGSPWALSRAPSTAELKMNRIRDFPGFLKEWDIDKLKIVLKNVGTLKKNVRQLGINPVDLQIMLGPDGIPVLVDLDVYRIGVDISALDLQIKTQARKIIEYYEFAHRKEFTREERLGLISLALE